MNLLICDDEPAVVEQVSALLRDHCEKSGISAHFYPFSDPDAIKDLSSYDLAFLDIDMGDSSGIVLAINTKRTKKGGYSLPAVLKIRTGYRKKLFLSNKYD